MQKSNRGVRILLMAMLMLWSSALIGCAAPKTIVMPESKAVTIKAGEAAPYSGWLLTDSAVAKLLEAAERCQAIDPQTTTVKK